MSQSDPIADMLSIIRNGLERKKENVNVPASNTKIEIVKILRDEGYIRDYEIEENRKQGIIKINLKYRDKNQPVVNGLQRISKPGRRVYCNKDNIPKVLDGIGVAIISTSKGIITDRKAEEFGVGGEVICYIW